MPNPPLHRPRASHVLLPTLALVVIAGGCKTYEARPLDIDADRATFLARTPPSPEVREFAAALAARSATPAPFDLADGVTLPEAELVALVFNPAQPRAAHRYGRVRGRRENL